MSELSCDTPFIGQIGALDLVRNLLLEALKRHGEFDLRYLEPHVRSKRAEHKLVTNVSDRGAHAKAA
jgi:hypothetical protein